jgi:hypothetical protein
MTLGGSASRIEADLIISRLYWDDRSGYTTCLWAGVGGS